MVQASHDRPVLRFQTANKAALSRAYAELGIEAPDFSKLSRKAALDAIAAFDARAATKANPSPGVRYASEILG